MKIYHETIDKRFTQYLEAIGKETFEDMFNSFQTTCEFYIDLYFDANLNFIFPNVANAVYRLEVQFEVEKKGDSFEISKDREFNMIHLKNNNVISCSADCHDFQVINCNPNYKGLQQVFNDWYYES